MIKARFLFPFARAGYSIVEMAIVLAVLGLLLGSILLPLSARFKGEQLQTTRDQLERVENAIFSYALRNSTKPSQALLTVSVGEKATSIPGGRPYLPCPDMSGDGLEDRFTPNNRLPSALQAPVSITLTLDSANDDVLLNRTRPVVESLSFTVTLSNSRANNSLVRDNVSTGVGACITDKGFVPWATLGLPSADIWGNRITYRVDPMFTNSVIGFGHETRSDPFDPRMPLATTVSAGQTLTVYQRRRLNGYVTVPFSVVGVAVDYYVDESPGVVCNAYSGSPGCSPYFQPAANITSELLNEAATAPLTLYDVYPNITIARIYNQEDILNGMAFVLVSHGPNGQGAVIDFPEGRLPYCRAITDNIDDPETENADFRFCSASAVGANPNSNIAVDTPVDHNDELRHHSFVALHHHSGADASYVFDDELRFMTGSELISKLAGLGLKYGGPWIPPLNR